MDKRNKHILINLTEKQYYYLKIMANKDKRKISDEAYLLILEKINSDFYKYIEHDDGDFKPLKYKSSDED